VKLHNQPMHPRHSVIQGRLVDYVEVQHALVATAYEKCRLRKSEEHFWQVSSESC